MDNIDLESLPYPMFETTEEEGHLLKFCLSQLVGSEWYLCVILLYTDSKGVDDLTSKIRRSLVPSCSLTGKLELSNLLNEDKVMLRRIWIRKLLEYKGDKSTSPTA